MANELNKQKTFMTLDESAAVLHTGATAQRSLGELSDNGLGVSGTLP